MLLSIFLFAAAHSSLFATDADSELAAKIERAKANPTRSYLGGYILSMYYQGFSKRIFDYWAKPAKHHHVGADIPSDEDLKTKVKIRDAAKAFEYAKKYYSAQETMTYEVANMANIYLQGIGTEKNIQKVLEILRTKTPEDFRRFETQNFEFDGFRFATPLVAYLYHHGIGVGKDFEKRDAILNEHALELAWRNFYCGYLVPQDYELAIYCLERRSDFWAADELVKIYSGEYLPEHKDEAKANYWRPIFQSRRAEFVKKEEEKLSNLIKEYEADPESSYKSLFILYGTKVFDMSLKFVFDHVEIRNEHYNWEKSLYYFDYIEKKESEQLYRIANMLNAYRIYGLGRSWGEPNYKIKDKDFLVFLEEKQIHYKKLAEEKDAQKKGEDAQVKDVQKQALDFIWQELVNSSFKTDIVEKFHFLKNGLFPADVDSDIFAVENFTHDKFEDAPNDINAINKHIERRLPAEEKLKYYKAPLEYMENIAQSDWQRALELSMYYQGWKPNTIFYRFDLELVYNSYFEIPTTDDMRFKERKVRDKQKALEWAEKSFELGSIRFKAAQDTADWKFWKYMNVHILNLLYRYDESDLADKKEKISKLIEYIKINKLYTPFNEELYFYARSKEIRFDEIVVDNPYARRFSDQSWRNYYCGFFRPKNKAFALQILKARPEKFTKYAYKAYFSLLKISSGFYDEDDYAPIEAKNYAAKTKEFKAAAIKKELDNLSAKPSNFSDYVFPLTKYSIRYFRQCYYFFRYELIFENPYYDKAKAQEELKNILADCDSVLSIDAIKQFILEAPAYGITEEDYNEFISEIRKNKRFKDRYLNSEESARELFGGRIPNPKDYE